MTEAVKAGPAVAAGSDLRIGILAENTSENSHLDELRKRFLSEIFDLPPCTATVVAELAFGSEGSR